MKHAKLDRIGLKIKSANCLLHQGLDLDAISLYWQVTRDCIFLFLTNKGIHFSSTNDAILQVILCVDDNTRTRIVQSEIIGTLAEWDEFFTLTSLQTTDFINNCNLIINTLGYGENY